MVVVPLPNCPTWPSPHARTVPSVSSANVVPESLMTEATPVRPLTAAGVLLLVVVPMPNRPQKLSPHARTVPSVSSA